MITTTNTTARLAQDSLGWDQARNQVRLIAALPVNWDGADAPAIEPQMIQAAFALATKLEGMGHLPPNDVYPLSDGNIMLEWQTNQQTVRIEIEGCRFQGKYRCVCGQRMVSKPGMPSTFEDCEWGIESSVVWLRPNDYNDISDCSTEFPLAA